MSLLDPDIDSVNSVNDYVIIDTLITIDVDIEEVWISVSGRFQMGRKFKLYWAEGSFH